MERSASQHSYRHSMNESVIGVTQTGEQLVFNDGIPEIHHEYHLEDHSVIEPPVVRTSMNESHHSYSTRMVDSHNVHQLRKSYASYSSIPSQHHIASSNYLPAHHATHYQNYEQSPRHENQFERVLDASHGQSYHSLSGDNQGRVVATYVNGQLVSGSPVMSNY